MVNIVLAMRTARTYANGVDNARRMIRNEEVVQARHPNAKTWRERLDRLAEQLNRSERFGRDDFDRGCADTLRAYLDTQRS